MFCLGALARYAVCDELVVGEVKGAIEAAWDVGTGAGTHVSPASPCFNVLEVC